MSAVCDRCFALNGAPTVDALIAAGWKPKNPNTPAEGYGWRCPACIGKPMIVPKRGKRGTRTR